jgi:hypothetical protein
MTILALPEDTKTFKTHLNQDSWTICRDLKPDSPEHDEGT